MSVTDRMVPPGAPQLGDRQVIRAVRVASQDEAVGELRKADVLIEGDRIAAIEADLGEVDAEEFSGEDRILLPGFVDTHRHTWQSLLRNISTDWTMHHYFAGVRGTMGKLYQPEEMYAANLLGVVEALNSGITTLVDWSHNNNTPEHADAAVQAVFDSGARVVYGYGDSNSAWLPVSDEPMSHDVVRIAKERFSSRDQLVTLALALRGPEFTTDAASAHDFQLARELDVPVTVHVGDGAFGAKRPVAWIYDRGFADERTTYVHCNTISDEEFDMIAETGGAISIAATGEMSAGCGMLATMRGLTRNIPLSLSIDTCITCAGDMFSSMRAVLASTRYLVNLDALAASEVVDPLPLLASDVLAFATQGGARAAWLEAEIGSVTVGKKADLVLLRTDTYSMTPLNYVAGAVIESGNPELVANVWVNGRLVKRNGTLVDHKLADIRTQAQQATDALFGRAGVPDPGRWRPLPYETV